MRIVALDLRPSVQEAEYISECLCLFKQKTLDLNLTNEYYQEWTKKIQLRMGCWNVMHWFRINNYPVLNPLNAEFIE